MQKTILTTLREALEEGSREQNFDSLYSYVEKQLKTEWEKQFPNLSNEEIKRKKIGEIYKILTIDNSFQILPEGNWTLKK